MSLAGSGEKVSAVRSPRKVTAADETSPGLLPHTLLDHQPMDSTFLHHGILGRGL